MKLAAIDGKGNYSIAGLSIYITSRLARFSPLCCPQAFTHISTAASIYSVNLLCVIAEQTAIDYNPCVGQQRVNIGIVLFFWIVAMIFD